jgi:predicted metal-binding membrane protein
MASQQRAFLGVSALLFTASAAVTVAWCGSMSAMGGMPMPGGWTMPMSWMRMPGQSWPGAAASFLGMWTVMMVAMMLPSLVPALWRYREAVGREAKACRSDCGTCQGEQSVPCLRGRLDRLTAMVGAGYFSIWTALGLIAFVLGVALASVEMQQPALASAVPLLAGGAVMAAGVLQLTKWKARQLACCRQATQLTGALRRGREEDPAFPADFGTAWRHGLRLGLRCCYCCAALTTILLILGVMDLRTMAIVTAAITAERLAPGGERVARVIGIAVVAVGLFLVARAVMPA